MTTITVKELKNRLERVLNSLEDYEDEDKVSLVSNTYFLGYCNTFLGISGYDGGYVSLDNIDENIVTDEEDEE